MKLTINVITRGRPKLLIKTIDSILANIELPETRLLICADDDDDLTVVALKLAKLGPKVVVSVAPREDSRGEKYDRALRLAPADVYLPAVDCALFKTKGFDRLILEAAAVFPDGIGCVYTPMANLSWPKFQAPTAGLVKKLGYIYCHDYPFWFVDHELDDIVKMIDRYSYADIDIDVSSMRPAKTIGLRDLAFWAAYFDARTNVRREIARSILEAPDFRELEWRKQLCMRNSALVEQRSMMITGQNRHESAVLEASRGGVDSANDERYQRIKSKAEKVLLANFAAMEAVEQAA